MIYEETVVLRQPFDEVVAQVRQALAGVGFGILTEIDLQATFETKLGLQIDPHLILGACNPNLASRAVALMPQIAVLLPCNVAIRDTADGVVVEAMDPGLMSTITDNPAIEPIAAEARSLIGEALSSLMSSGGG